MNKKKQIIVIGAGPAGLAAALGALKEGASVLVLEHMPSPGRKLLLTGNGECNLSNTEVCPEHYHGIDGVIRSVLSTFSYNDMIAFMEEIGVPTVTDHYRFEKCGYLYPADHSSGSVLNALLEKIRSMGGKVITGSSIKNIKRGENSFFLETDQESICSDRLVFATGSNACPVTGSDSSIYPLLKSLGIIQKTWLPALVALKSDSKELKALAGLRAEASVQITDLYTGETFVTPDGEVQFREHYISGLPVLQLSRYAAIALHEGHSVLLKAMLHKATNKDGKLPFKELNLRITGTAGFEKAICCSGGVRKEDICPETLEAKNIPGLYFAGEMLDVDGDCGGFNLHFAFASGLLAGRNAAYDSDKSDQYTHI